MTETRQISATAVLVAGRRLPFYGIKETSEVYRATIDRLGLGGSQTPRCEILDGDTVVAHVSYNGRVWAGDGANWTPDVEPIFDPYAEGDAQ